MSRVPITLTEPTRWVTQPFDIAMNVASAYLDVNAPGSFTGPFQLCRRANESGQRLGTNECSISIRWCVRPYSAIVPATRRGSHGESLTHAVSDLGLHAGDSLRAHGTVIQLNNSPQIRAAVCAVSRTWSAPSSSCCLRTTADLADIATEGRQRAPPVINGLCETRISCPPHRINCWLMQRLRRRGHLR